MQSSNYSCSPPHHLMLRQKIYYHYFWLCCPCLWGVWRVYNTTRPYDVINANHFPFYKQIPSDIFHFSQLYVKNNIKINANPPHLTSDSSLFVCSILVCEASQPLHYHHYKRLSIWHTVIVRVISSLSLDLLFRHPRNTFSSFSFSVCERVAPFFSIPFYYFITYLFIFMVKNIKTFLVSITPGKCS